jgi:tripartite-type tricarboxylate transporter receptor subunit TctC
MFTDPKTRESLTGEGADPIASSPAAFAAFVRAEIKKWDEVGKAANIQPTE